MKLEVNYSSLYSAEMLVFERKRVCFKLVFLENFRNYGVEEANYRLIETKDLQLAASNVTISYDAERYKNLEKSFKDLVAQDASR